MTIVVSQVEDDDQLEGIFEEVRADYSGRGGWHVRIDCGTSAEDEGGSRQANGRFVDSSRMGRARTGLDAYSAEYEVLDDRRPCPSERPTATASAVTAEEIVDAFIAEGLPAADPRDNSGVCDDAQCVQLITTDDVSVYQFADAERATYWASSVFKAYYQRDTIILRYTLDGSHPTPDYAKPGYEAVVDRLMPDLAMESQPETTSESDEPAGDPAIYMGAPCSKAQNNDVQTGADGTLYRCLSNNNPAAPYSWFHANP